MFTFVARFFFKNQHPESLLIEVRTKCGKLYTANKTMKSNSHYRQLSEHLQLSNYKVQRGPKFLILRIGQSLIKLTEKEFVSLDKRELTLAKLNLLQKPNEPVVLDESKLQANKLYEMAVQDLQSNFKLVPIKFAVKQSQQSQSTKQKESLLIKNSEAYEQLRATMSSVVTMNKQLSDLWELRLEDKNSRLRATQIRDVRKNKLKYSIKKDAQKVPQNVLNKTSKELYCLFGKGGKATVKNLC